MGLSVALITYNEELNILRFLDSVQEIADEIIIVDSFSTDKTKEICENYPSQKIIFTEKKFEGYGEQKNFTLNLCTQDWILFLDADEIPDETLKNEIVNIINSNNKNFHVYKIKLNNHLAGYHLKYGGWGNVYRERFFQKDYAKFSDDKIHEHLVTEEKIGQLTGNINHYTYKDINHHVDKINKYSDMMAEKMLMRGKKISYTKIVLGPAFEFFKVYFFKLGFLDGFPGFYVAKTMSYYTFLKYMKLFEKTYLLPQRKPE